MFARVAGAALVLGLAAIPATIAGPAQADPAKDYLFQERLLRQFCPPALKFAAGACLPYCPAGFEDNGSYCRLRNQSSPSGGGRW
jgi:hypothetical protein